MEYQYKALKQGGEVVRGTFSAKDKEHLYEELKSQGLTLVTAEAEGHSKGLAWAYEFNAQFGRVKEEEKIMFAENLAAMLEAGLPVGRALSVIDRQTKNQKFKKILRVLQDTIQEGQPLSSGLEKYPSTFPSLFVSMVRSGEESGQVVDSLKITANQMEQSYKLKRKVRGAMMYPSIIMIAMIIIGILMLIYVVPTLSETFTELGAELPASTQFVINSSNFLKNNVFLSLLGIVVLIGGLIMLFRHPKTKGPTEAIILKLPVVGELVKEVNAARTARTLSSLMAAGVDVVHALEITEDVVQNSHYKKVIGEVTKQVQKGGVMADTFQQHENLYPPMFGEMIAVGEETGQLSKLLIRVATFYEEDVDQKTKDMSTIIEPFLMVIIGAAVGFFAVSMITPMYSLSSGF